VGPGPLSEPVAAQTMEDGKVIGQTGHCNWISEVVLFNFHFLSEVVLYPFVSSSLCSEGMQWLQL
jgi:hypothetical protein